MFPLFFNATYVCHLVRKIMNQKSTKETHYTILNLKEDCTAKEIKDAFIMLSKKYHPDCTKDKKSHTMFLKVNEAYSILNKPYSRRIYDQHLSNEERVYHHYYENIYTTRSNASFWANRFKGMKFANEPYYGIKGIKKVSNGVIVLICIAVASVGLGIEVVALSKSFTFDRERLRHDSARNQIFLELARNQATDNGNEVQIRKFKDNRLRGVNVKDVTHEYQRRLCEETANEEEKDKIK